MSQLEFHQRAAEHLEEIMPLLDKEMGKHQRYSSSLLQACCLAADIRIGSHRLLRLGVQQVCCKLSTGLIQVDCQDFIHKLYPVCMIV